MLKEAFKCRHHWAVDGRPWEDDGSPLRVGINRGVAAKGRMSTDEGRMTASKERMTASKERMTACKRRMIAAEC